MSFDSDDKSKGRRMMEKYFEHLKMNLLQILLKDQKVRADAFNDILTPTIFIDFVFTMFLKVLLEKQDNCKSLLELIKHSIY